MRSLKIITLATVAVMAFAIPTAFAGEWVYRIPVVTVYLDDDGKLTIWDNGEYYDMRPDNPNIKQAYATALLCASTRRPINMFIERDTVFRGCPEECPRHVILGVGISRDY